MKNSMIAKNRQTVYHNSYIVINISIFFFQLLSTKKVLNYERTFFGVNKENKKITKIYF